jgi:cytochrome c551/c552/glucose/arabinose dehydrogenase
MKRKLTRAFLLVSTAVLIFQCAVTRQNTIVDNAPKQKQLARDTGGRIIVNTNPSAAYLSPQESLHSIYVPKGYHLQLVASEPMIKEPVAIVWDGNGRMYVSEMLTYMQDVNGTKENDPVSRISMLEDTNGDGVMDKSSVYIDSLLLPRMMLCVGKKLLVSETYTNNIWSYEDANNDGKVDKKEQVFGNNTRNTANLEHQRSGLIWNLDNRIYTTYENLRYRYVNGKLEADTMLTGSGQWGLGNDDYGRLYYSSAGGEVAAYSFQLNPLYGKYEVNGQLDGDFNAVWPIIATPDVQGGLGRLRPDSTLNHFTASCGQSVFRGNALPEDLNGDLLICEPVGRLIRRAKVMNRDGVRILQNAYNKEEFIASTDMNFRPVNTATGPDGCLYIVDMHRGIIQEGNWTREGSYLRPKILEKELDKNIGHGRIYRLVHDGYKPGPMPVMLNECSQQLVNYLTHANGWWRDNAQKELIVRNDRAVIATLQQMAQEHTDHLARIHALWTLEGLQAIDKKVLAVALKDTDARVRKTAVTISEEFLKKQDKEMLAMLSSLTNDADADVQAQLAASLAYYSGNELTELLSKLVSKAANPQYITGITRSIQASKDQKRYGLNLSGLSASERTIVLKGHETFQQVCATCHGGDGKGISIGGNPMPAPPLANSKRAGNKAALIRILLHGLSGPVDGKTYPDVMAPLGAANSNEWVATVLSFVHYRFRPRDAAFAMISEEDVKKVRTAMATRTKLWTLDEVDNETISDTIKKGNANTATIGPAKEMKKAGPVVKPVVKQPVKKPGQSFLEGKNLLSKQDCNACHKPDVKLVGPSYKSIAQKYKSNEANVSMLAAKVIAGGGGNWGQVPMTPHAAMSITDAKKIVRYVLSLSGK